MAGNIVIHILGDTTGLGRAIRVAQRNVSTLHTGIAQLSAAASGALVTIGAVGAAGIGAGAVASGALLGMTAAVGGGLAYMAAQNEEVSQSFSTLKENVKASGQEFTKSLHQPMIAFAGQLETAFNAMGPSITRLSDAFGPMLNTIGAKLVPLAGQLGLMLETAFTAGQGPMQAFVDGLGPVIDGLNGMFKALDRPEITQFVKTFMETLGGLLPVLGELLAALTPVGTQLLEALLPAFKDMSGFIIENVIPLMTQLTGFLSDHPGLITGLVAAWASFKIAMIATNLALGLTRIGLTGLMILRAPVLAMTAAWTAAQWLLNTAFLGFPLVWILAAIAAVVAAGIWVYKNWDNITKWLGQAWEWIKNVATNVWNAIKNFFINTWNSITSFIGNAVSNIRNAISNGFNAAKNAVVTILNGVISFIMGLPGRFFSMGADLIRGMINGIGSMGAALANKARSIASGAVNAIKGFLGISSPSKLMMQFGVWFGEGFIDGMDDTTKDIAKTAKSLGVTAFKELRKSTDGMDRLMQNRMTIRGTVELDSGIAARNSGSGNTINVTVQAGIGDPVEIGRQVKSVIREYEKYGGNR